MPTKCFQCYKNLKLSWSEQRAAWFWTSILLVIHWVQKHTSLPNQILQVYATLPNDDSIKHSNDAQGDCFLGTHIVQESSFSLLIITPKKKKTKTTGSTPFATWGDYSLWLPRSPAFFRSVRDWSKVKWVGRGSLLAEAELLHRKEGKFMGSERQYTRPYHREHLNWDLVSAASMNKPLVQKVGKVPLYVLLSSKPVSPGYGIFFACSSEVPDTEQRYLSTWLGCWNIYWTSLLLLFWQVMSKITTLQESKLENSICRCLDTMYRQMEQINLQKQMSQKALQKHQVKLFFLAVQMWEQKCTKFLGSVLKDTANCWLTKRYRIRTPFPLLLTRFRGSSRTGAEATAKRTLWSTVIHPVLPPLQLFLEEHSIWVKISVAKPGIKTASCTLLPFQEGIRSNPRAWLSTRLCLAAPGVQAVLLNLQPSVASWRAVIFQERAEQEKT